MTLRYEWGTPECGCTGAGSRWAARRRARGCALTALIAAGMTACNSQQRELGSSEPAPEVSVAAQPLRQAPAAAGATSAAPTAGGASSAIGDRPSVDENMGRGFQGTLALRVVGHGKSYRLRYQSRGNSARLQLDPLGREQDAAGRHLDALIWDQNISLLDHEQRSVRTLAMDDISPHSDEDASVKLDKTGERTTLLGVGCERYEISEGRSRISACVGALPGSFDIDKFESVSGVDVPAWVEELIRDELLPLKGSLRDETGRELYTFELTEYTPGPVDAAQLVLPQNYKVVAQPARTLE